MLRRVFAHPSGKQRYAAHVWTRGEVAKESLDGEWGSLHSVYAYVTPGGGAYGHNYPNSRHLQAIESTFVILVKLPNAV